MSAVGLRLKAEDRRASWTERLVYKGKKRYGVLIFFDDGRRAYFAFRKHREIYRGGLPSLSEGIRAGRAGWALDDETLILMRMHHVRYVGVIVEDTGDKYLSFASWWDWKDKKLTGLYWQDYTDRGGSKQRVMPLQTFRIKPGEIVSLR